MLSHREMRRTCEILDVQFNGWSWSRIYCTGRNGSVPDDQRGHLQVLGEPARHESALSTHEPCGHLVKQADVANTSQAGACRDPCGAAWPAFLYGYPVCWSGAPALCCQVSHCHDTPCRSLFLVAFEHGSHAQRWPIRCCNAGM